MRTIGFKILGCAVFLIFFAISSLISGILVKVLWNWLMPDIFGLPAITYLQGVGLSYLCSILFKSTTSSSKKSED